MSRFTVNLAEPPEETGAAFEKQPAILPAESTAPKKPSAFVKFLKITGVTLAVVLLVGAIGSYLYWRSVKKTPEYSLALLVRAARRDDTAEMERLVDTEAVVDNFMPQVTDKAVELYGRNLPPQVIAKVERVAAPVIPIIKERAKTELPRVIREKTEPVEKVPYWVIALFARRAINVSIEKDTATITSKLPERPLELTMKRDVDGWKVTAMKDDVLARKIAEKIGQDIIAAASKGGIKKAAEQLGVKDLDQLRDIDIFK